MSSSVKQLILNGHRVPSLTRSQLAVLGAIAKQPKGSRVTAKVVGFELGIHENAAQQRLVRMQKIGLVRRGGWEVAK